VIIIHRLYGKLGLEEEEETEWTAGGREPRVTGRCEGNRTAYGMDAHMLDALQVRARRCGCVWTDSEAAEGSGWGGPYARAGAG
jgi:hypothetical protein